MANGPLTERDLEQINGALEEIERAEGVIAQAKQAGIDLARQEVEARETKEKLLRIKQAFFPGR
jgi:predicted negative regulator of RcsB-dependent stress response